MHRVPFILFVALLLVPRAAWPQGNPLSPEFRVNTYTTDFQYRGSVAADSAGNFVVIWTSGNQDGSSNGVFGQRYLSAGAPEGLEFRVNTYTTSGQGLPSVAADSSGNFVVVWTSSFQDGSYSGVFGQRYASTGTPLGPEFRVNTYTTYYQDRPSVAAGSAGNFVVVWDGVVYPGYPVPPVPLGIFGQRYASAGSPLGPEFRVNTNTTIFPVSPAVAADTSGNFVVVWGSYGSPSGIFGQRYASSGTPLGPEFRVNTYTTSSKSAPSVAADSSGNFVVVWRSNTQDGSDGGIFAQRFAGTGAALGPEFRVNTYTTGDQTIPAVASDATGNFVVVWTSSGQDGSSFGVFGQRYASSGAPDGPEFRVNTYTTNNQWYPSVAAAPPSGNFVVVWDSFPQDGSAAGLFGQRYGRIVPVELLRFIVE